MSTKTNRLETDADSKPIPQVYNPTLDKFVSVEGDANGMNVQVKSALPAGLNNIGKVDINTIPEVEVKNDSGNPLSVSSADGGMVSIGAKADTAVIDPAVSASQIALLKGVLKQAQGNGTGKAPIIDQTQTLTTAPITRIVTLTETPIALTSKANLKKITIRNIHLVLRARIGETGMTPANNKGIALEPGAMYQETFDPVTPVIIYGRSEGASIMVEVYEV